LLDSRGVFIKRAAPNRTPRNVSKVGLPYIAGIGADVVVTVSRGPTQARNRRQKYRDKLVITVTGRYIQITAGPPLAAQGIKNTIVVTIGRVLKIITAVPDLRGQI
jgi:hypothetical protein